MRRRAARRIPRSMNIGNTMAKRNKTAHAAARTEQPAGQSKKGAASRADAYQADDRPAPLIEKPIWNDQTGQLSWKGRIVLELAMHARSERAILSGFQLKNWRWVIENPLARAELGDPTQEGRHALYNLNKHQRPKETLRFFSIRGGFMGWCDAKWLRESEQ